MSQDYCTIYSMDIERRAGLIRLLELSKRDHKVADCLHREFLDPAIDIVVEDFYTYLLGHTEYTAILNPDRIPALKRTQSEYLRSFGVGFDTGDYFNNRLLIGIAHKQADLSLGLYQCAYRRLQHLILRLIPENYSHDGISGRDLCDFVHKVTALDMTLAIETYHEAHILAYEDSLDELRNEGEELREQVTTDGLTNVATHAHGIHMLNKCLSDPKVSRGICVIMADIDYFKRINDKFGHLCGDEVLRELGVILKSAVREFDTVCRYGGEEFMIVLCNTSPAVAERVARRIHKQVREMSIEYNDETVRVTISQGIAFAQKNSNSRQLLEEADSALYRAKDEGRDRVVVSGADVTGC